MSLSACKPGKNAQQLNRQTVNWYYIQLLVYFTDRAIFKSNLRLHADLIATKDPSNVSQNPYTLFQIKMCNGIRRNFFRGRQIVVGYLFAIFEVFWCKNWVLRSWRNSAKTAVLLLQCHHQTARSLKASKNSVFTPKHFKFGKSIADYYVYLW